MATFKKTVDIWSLTDEQIAELQPGQYVTAGHDGPKGRFLAKGASTVVAWTARFSRGERRKVYFSKYVEMSREVRANAKKAA